MSSLQKELLASTERSTSPTTCHMTEMALVARTQCKAEAMLMLIRCSLDQAQVGGLETATWSG